MVNPRDTYKNGQRKQNEDKKHNTENEKDQPNGPRKKKHQGELRCS